jgi:hypothetical protein
MIEGIDLLESSSVRSHVATMTPIWNLELSS